jgi:dTDP-4-amino-4,6-dideoxygalactose transaminase
MDIRIPLTDLRMGEPEIEAVAEVLRSRWLTSGARTRQFETRFAELLGAERAYAVSSCTAALHLAFAALDIGPGDEVICPDLTFVATANAVRYTGAEPVLAASVSRNDLTLSPDHVESLIGPKTRAICLMHYGGYACDMEAFETLAERHDLRLIEDCAHSPLGFGRRGAERRALGTFGVAGCFSFFGTKNVSTGEGGMVVTSDPDVGERIDRLRTHGITVPTFDRHRKPVIGYDITGLGFNYRFDDLRAAIGLCQLERLHEINAARRERLVEYRSVLAGSDAISMPFAGRDLADSAAHLMVVHVDADSSAVRAQLRERGIQTSKHYDPISSFELYGGSDNGPAAPVADGLITLPLGPHMSTGDVEDVSAELRRAVRANPRQRAA